MNDENQETGDRSSVPEPDWRQRLLKANLSLPSGRVRATKKAAPARTAALHSGRPPPLRPRWPIPAARNTFPSRARCTSGYWTSWTGETYWRRARRR